MNRPRLVLTELREYGSEWTGDTYSSGYLGKAHAVMLRYERAECTGKEAGSTSTTPACGPRRSGSCPASGAATDAGPTMQPRCV